MNREVEVAGGRSRPGVAIALGRLFASIRLELIHQYRQGFYAATAVLLVVWVALLSALPAAAGPLVPAFVLTNMTITTFYFVGGLAMLERDQGLFPVLGVTPIPPWQYLVAKLATLGLIVALESLAILGLSYGLGLALPLGEPSSWPGVLAGIGLGTVLFTASGFGVLVRFGSINEALLPSSLIALVLEWPSLAAFRVDFGPFNDLFPLQGAWLLLRSPWEPLSVGRVAFAIASTVAWTIAAWWFADRSYRRVVGG